MFLPPTPADHTVADLLAVYARDYFPHKAPHTQYQEGLLHRRFLREFGSIPLPQLTPLILRTWRDRLRTRYKPGTVRRYMVALSAVLQTAVDDYEWLPRNPMRHKALKPPAPPGRERCLTAEELERLLAACAAYANPLLVVAVRLILYTATRKNELLQRQWREIDLERHLLSIPQSKNGTRRAIPLVAPAVGLLRELKAHAASVWVFARADGRKPVLLDYGWRESCAKAGIADFHVHDLRHTSATYLAMHGANVQQIQLILGHKTLGQTMRYIHLMEPSTRAILQGMADAFLASLLGVWTLATLASTLLAPA